MRFSASTGCFYPEWGDYGDELPSDIVAVPDEDLEKAMSRGINQKIKLVNGRIVVEDLIVDELALWRASIKCGPLQMRRALRASGLYDIVNGYMDAAPEEVSEAWEYATEIFRLDPLVLGIKSALGKTDEEVDDLFRLALTFA